jgi:hypothetical protein
MFNDPIGLFTSGTNCDEVRTTRAFLIIGLIFASIAFLLSWLAYNSFDDIMYRMPAMFFAGLACQ